MEQTTEAYLSVRRGVCVHVNELSAGMRNGITMR